MIYRSTKEQIDAYYAHNAINQSALKELIQSGVEAFIDKYQMIVSTSELYYEEKAHFIIGNAVDCRITQGIDEFNRQYHISSLIKKPGEKAMSIVKSIYDKLAITPEVRLDLTLADQIIEACIEHKYYEKWKPETRVNSIIKEGTEYFEDLKKAVGKQILSDIESQTTINVYNSLTNHPHTANLFKDGDDIDIVYQFPVFFTINGVECKGLIDKIIINHTTKKIMPCDIKTMGDYITNFRRKVKSLRYDIQGSFYSYGVSQNLTQLATLINKHLIGYTISNFAFIAESTIKQGCPLVFVLTKKLLEQGKIGDSTAEGSLRFGWQYGINLYKAWSELEFKVEKAVEKTNGVVFIDENYEYTNL